MQLYKKDVRIYDPENKFINQKDIDKKFGVKPEQIIDVQALQVTSDKVPYVPGIGIRQHLN